MTIEALNIDVGYTGDGVTEDFVFNMKTNDSSWIRVFIDGILYTGSIVTSLGLDQSSAPGGSVKISPPQPVGADILIIRIAFLDQLINFASYNGFPAVVSENGLDKSRVIDQQQQAEINRSLKLKINDDGTTSVIVPDYDSDKLFKWDPVTKKVSLTGFTGAQITALLNGGSGGLHPGVSDNATGPVLFLDDAKIDMNVNQIVSTNTFPQIKVESVDLSPGLAGFELSVPGIGAFTIRYDGSSELTDRFEIIDDIGNVIMFSINGSNEVNFPVVNVGTVNADVVAIGNTTLSPSLDVVSVTRGILIPRMTSAQRDAISGPNEGEEIYNLTTNLKNYWNGTDWMAISAVIA